MYGRKARFTSFTRLNSQRMQVHTFFVVFVFLLFLFRLWTTSPIRL